jgi:hypothetical protein
MASRRGVPASRRASPATWAGGPPGAKNPTALLNDALSELVTITENGRRRKITKREAVIKQLVNKSASADARSLKILLDLMLNLEARARSSAAPPPRRRPGRRGGPGTAEGEARGCYQGCDCSPEMMRHPRKRACEGIAELPSPPNHLAPLARRGRDPR